MAEPQAGLLQRLLARAVGGLRDLRGSPGHRGCESGQGLELLVSSAREVVLPAPGWGRVYRLPAERTPCSVSKNVLGTTVFQATGLFQWGAGGLRGPFRCSLLCPTLSRSLHAAP